MTQRAVNLPRETIQLSEYRQLAQYLSKFAQGELGLVLLLGRHGTGKSECVRRILKLEDRDQCQEVAHALYIEGHMRPFGLYRQLYNHRHRPIVLDDLDRLYADPDCVRLLKPLCNTIHHKRLHWLTDRTTSDSTLPPTFTTSSNVILIANEWRSLNPNVRALEDRAIILHFCPSNQEVHREVGKWFHDGEVYQFMAELLPVVPAVSMRHYAKGSQLRRAGLTDWRLSLLQMAVPDRRDAAALAVQHDVTLQTEQDRVAQFIAKTGACRATYFRIKARLSAMM